MADPEDESPTEPETRSSVTRGIASLFLWNQVLVISSLFLAMLGVNSLMAEVTITKIAITLVMMPSGRPSSSRNSEVFVSTAPSTSMLPSFCWRKIAASPKIVICKTRS